jgi:hypothetical protein
VNMVAATAPTAALSLALDAAQECGTSTDSTSPAASAGGSESTANAGRHTGANDAASYSFPAAAELDSENVQPDEGEPRQVSGSMAAQNGPLNTQHTNMLALFVPAPVLYRYLQLCGEYPLDPLQAAAKAARSRATKRLKGHPRYVTYHVQP